MFLEFFVWRHSVSMCLTEIFMLHVGYIRCSLLLIRCSYVCVCVCVCVCDECPILNLLITTWDLQGSETLCFQGRVIDFIFLSLFLSNSLHSCWYIIFTRILFVITLYIFTNDLLLFLFSFLIYFAYFSFMSTYYIY